MCLWRWSCFYSLFSNLSATVNKKDQRCIWEAVHFYLQQEQSHLPSEKSPVVHIKSEENSHVISVSGQQLGGTTQNFLQSPPSFTHLVKKQMCPCSYFKLYNNPGKRRDRRESSPVWGRAVRLLHRGSKNHAKPLSHKFFILTVLIKYAK